MTVVGSASISGTSPLGLMQIISGTLKEDLIGQSDKVSTKGC